MLYRETGTEGLRTQGHGTGTEARREQVHYECRHEDRLLKVVDSRLAIDTVVPSPDLA